MDKWENVLAKRFSYGRFYCYYFCYYYFPNELTKTNIYNRERGRVTTYLKFGSRKFMKMFYIVKRLMVHKTTRFFKF